MFFLPISRFIKHAKMSEFTTWQKCLKIYWRQILKFPPPPVWLCCIQSCATKSTVNYTVSVQYTTHHLAVIYFSPNVPTVWDYIINMQHSPATYTMHYAGHTAFPTKSASCSILVKIFTKMLMDVLVPQQIYIELRHSREFRKLLIFTNILGK